MWPSSPMPSIGSMVPGWIDPSGRIASQRSQTVVAPWRPGRATMARPTAAASGRRCRSGPRWRARAARAACRESPSPRAPLQHPRVRQGRSRPRALGLRGDPQLEGDRASRLGLEGMRRPPVPRQARDPIGERRIRLGCRRLADDSGGVGEQPGAPREERVGDVVGVALGEPRTLRRRIGIQPVAELPRWDEQPVRAAPVLERPDPAEHARVLAAQDVGVAVRLVDGPRDDRRGVAQPARPNRAVPSRTTSGTTLGTPSSSSWSSSRSRSQLCQNASDSTSVQAVGANACASPVHPRRSSRWGQSVGSETKLPRSDHRTFSCSLFSRSSEQVKVDRRRRSLLMATTSAPSTAAVVSISA